jgi:hypothetical protein
LRHQAWKKTGFSVRKIEELIAEIMEVQNPPQSGTENRLNEMMPEHNYPLSL